MKLRSLLILSLSSLAIVSSIPQYAASSAVVNISDSATSAPVQSLTQLAQSQQSTVIKSGTFVSGEHKTQGTVRITKKNGKSFLSLDRSFKTSSSGPDLVVILHRKNNVIGSTKPPAYPIKKGDYIVLAPLKKYSGAQTYVIPSNINLANYKSAAIWCRKFNATFGAASLSS
ncbi:MAG: DM13 domain-containing protein [Goleter apudmare HA4340-LM2]|jgi:hypothetical protein|nr:DM13 domain-containing protein [Goleter apudmare HA4340-LM2]